MKKTSSSLAETMKVSWSCPTTRPNRPGPPDPKATGVSWKSPAWGKLVDSEEDVSAWSRSMSGLVSPCCGCTTRRERRASWTARKTASWTSRGDRKRTQALVGWTLTSSSWRGMEMISTAEGNSWRASMGRYASIKVCRSAVARTARPLTMRVISSRVRRAREKLEPGRRVEEEVLGLHGGAGLRLDGEPIDDFPARSSHERARGCSPRTRGDLEPAHRADGGQRLAPEAEGGDGGEVGFVRDLGGGVPQKGQVDVARVHAEAVVADADELASGVLQLDGDGGAAGVDGVLDQLLDHRG